jgi:hypothetical protein
LAMSLATTSSITWWLRRPESAADIERIMDGSFVLGAGGPGWLRGVRDVSG